MVQEITFLTVGHVFGGRMMFLLTPSNKTGFSLSTKKQAQQRANRIRAKIPQAVVRVVKVKGERGYVLYGVMPGMSVLNEGTMKKKMWNAGNR